APATAGGPRGGETPGPRHSPSRPSRAAEIRIAAEDTSELQSRRVRKSEQLDLAKSARLVGNFANEKELFFMMRGSAQAGVRALGDVECGGHAAAVTAPAWPAHST